MSTAIERYARQQGVLLLYFVTTLGESEIIIEAVSRDVAVNVYASITGLHPDSISCSCCGPHGYGHLITQKWALEEIDNGTRFVFENEYTAEQVQVGAALYYDMREQGY